MNNIEEFSKAKNESEPVFESTALTSSEFDMICPATNEQDMKLHADFIAVFNKRIVIVDVKHVTSKNAFTGNYSISHSLKTFNDDYDLGENHMLAFRLAVDGELSGKFLCAYTHEVFSKCELKPMHNDKTGQNYWLVGIDDVKHNCAYVVID